jgi:hypothetical protein
MAPVSWAAVSFVGDHQGLPHWCTASGHRIFFEVNRNSACQARVDVNSDHAWTARRPPNMLDFGALEDHGGCSEGNLAATRIPNLDRRSLQ